jgi:hypothetical protein
MGDRTLAALGHSVTGAQLQQHREIGSKCKCTERATSIAATALISDGTFNYWRSGYGGCGGCIRCGKLDS